MTTADFAFALARINLAASVAVALVMLLRGPVRRCFGPHLAYGLWLLPLIAAAGALTQGPADGPAAQVLSTGRDWLATDAHAERLCAVWAAGAVLAAALAAWRQARFAAAERAGRAGPAVVGMIQPRLVVPRDFAERFTAEQRRLVRAHELAHVERGDPRWNAVAALAAWACWFNPLTWAALHCLRIDQEMACDATVVEARPTSRRAYARTLAQVSPSGLTGPLVSCLLDRGHPLEVRLHALLQDRPTQGRQDAGLAGLVALAAATFAAAWALQPPAFTPAAQPTLTLVQFNSPTPALTAWVYENLPPRPGPR